MNQRRPAGRFSGVWPLHHLVHNLLAQTGTTTLQQSMATTHCRAVGEPPVVLTAASGASPPKTNDESQQSVSFAAGDLVVNGPPFA